MAGGVRDQYHHAADIVPTILDCAGIEPPQLVNGHLQAPLPGVSMRYTFTAPDAPSARRTQLYQAPGGRAVYHDGWKAATGASRWELYRVATDRAEPATWQRATRRSLPSSPRYGRRQEASSRGSASSRPPGACRSWAPAAHGSPG